MVLSDYDGQAASGVWWAGAVIRANYTGLVAQENTWGCLLSTVGNHRKKDFKQESDLLGFKGIILANE